MYIKITPNGPIRYSITDLRRDHPQTCFPIHPCDAALVDFDVYPLTPTEQPIVDESTQVVVEGIPVLTEGKWTQQWSVRNLTSEELLNRIPKSVTALQGMRAIQAAGLVSAFLAWKITLDPVTDFETLAFLEKAQTWVYDDPILNEALEQLNITEQKNALFTLASIL
jgi:hypothetical protein